MDRGVTRDFRDVLTKKSGVYSIETWLMEKAGLPFYSSANRCWERRRQRSQLEELIHTELDWACTFLEADNCVLAPRLQPI